MKEKIKKTEKIEKLEKEGLASYSFQASPIGFVTVVTLFLGGIGSIFIYRLVFGLSILTSIISGLITWIVFGIIVDKIVVKIMVRNERKN